MMMKNRKPRTLAACLAIMAGTMILAAVYASAASFEADAASAFGAMSDKALELRDRNLNQHQLLSLLQDRDPGVRQAALRGTRYAMQDRRIQEVVIAMLLNRNEKPEIRLDAARALSYDSGERGVTEALIWTANNAAETSALRVMACKALWSSSGQRDSRDFLMAAADRHPEPAIREAAAWALFNSSGDPRARDLLVQLLRRNNPAALRLEAVKSLYSSAHYREVQENLIQIARRSDEPMELRVTSVLALSFAPGDSVVRRFLEEEMEYGRVPELRAAAVEAASPEPGKMRALFHLGHKMENGPFISPMENE